MPSYPSHAPCSIHTHTFTIRIANPPFGGNQEPEGNPHGHRKGMQNSTQKTPACFRRTMLFPFAHPSRMQHIKTRFQNSHLLQGGWAKQHPSSTHRTPFNISLHRYKKHLMHKGLTLHPSHGGGKNPIAELAPVPQKCRGSDCSPDLAVDGTNTRACFQ